jgi:hypothetical protein
LVKLLPFRQERLRESFDDYAVVFGLAEPRKFDVVIHGKVAEQIGLEIPSDVLRLAGRIFK